MLILNKWQFSLIYLTFHSTLLYCILIILNLLSDLLLFLSLFNPMLTLCFILVHATINNVTKTLPYFGKRKQVTYHLNLSYWCFCIVPSVFFFQAKFYDSTLILLRDMLGKTLWLFHWHQWKWQTKFCSLTRNVLSLASFCRQRAELSSLQSALLFVRLVLAPSTGRYRRRRARCCLRAGCCPDWGLLWGVPCPADRGPC